MFGGMAGDWIIFGMQADVQGPGLLAEQGMADRQPHVHLDAVQLQPHLTPSHLTSPHPVSPPYLVPAIQARKDTECCWPEYSSTYTYESHLSCVSWLGQQLPAHLHPCAAGPIRLLKMHLAAQPRFIYRLFRLGCPYIH